MAADWKPKLDPSDHLDYVAEFATGNKPVLETGEKIATYSLELSAAAIEAGLVVDTAGEFAHEKIDDDKSVKLWLSVDEAKRNDPRFVRGLKLGVIITIETDSMPPRTRQRTWNVTVVQQ